MAFRKLLGTALAVVLVGVATGVSTGAHAANHSMSLTFNRPVALPGVTLAAGTYVFEIPVDTGDHSLVRVSSKDRRIVYLTAFTALIDRPAGTKPDRMVTFGEAAPDRPTPITVWWPENSPGRQFIYPNK